MDNLEYRFLLEKRLHRMYIGAAMGLVVLLGLSGFLVYANWFQESPYRLHQAVQDGDIDGLKAALDAGADVNTRDGRGWTALMHAANQGYTLMVEPLLDAGANPDVRAADGATALFMAARRGDSEIVAALLKAGADPSIKGPKGKMPMEVGQEHFAVVAVLEGVRSVFRDCPECPELVVVPSGTYMMGSSESEKRRSSNEGPRRPVTIEQPLAVGVYEVTFDEWDACMSGGGCNGYRPNDRGWGRGRRPVLGVSWEDAQAYAEWLSRKTGQQYRLPSESEWEYVARAGTVTPFHFGKTISTEQANYDGDYRYGTGRKGVDRKQTVEVGSFPPNGFGLHDVHGNVQEWVQDCWNGSYRGGPSDGSAWERGDCSKRVYRGGSWGHGPWKLRSAKRDWSTSRLQISNIGFRIARSLTP